MKKFFSAIFCTVLVSLSAQSFTVTTNYVSFSGNSGFSDIPSPSWTPVIHNSSGDTLTLRWVREEHIPSYWRSSVCTQQFCSSIPDDSLEWKMLPGDSDMTYIHIYPYGFADTGNVVLRIFNVDNPSDSVRVMYHCDVTTNITEHDQISYIHADLFSHAVTFSPAEQGTWMLVDVAGNVIATEKTIPGSQYSAAVTDAGVYFFTFVSESGFVEVHKLIL